MSRRCRASLLQGASGGLTGGDLSSGCDCGRLAVPGIPCKDIAVPAFPSLDVVTLRVGLGPEGDEIPFAHLEGFFKLIFSDGAEAEPPLYFKENYHPDFPPVNNLTIETADPPPNATFYFFAAAGEGLTANRIRLASGFTCDGSAFRRPYVSIVQPGDLVTFGCVAKASTLDGNPRVAVNFTWYNQQGADLGFPQETQFTLDTGYQPFSVSYFIPEIPEMYVVSILFRQVFDNDAAAWYVGQPHAQVLPAGQGILLCAQFDFITIDNDTTETAFL